MVLFLLGYQGMKFNIVLHNFYKIIVKIVI